MCGGTWDRGKQGRRAADGMGSSRGEEDRRSIPDHPQQGAGLEWKGRAGARVRGVRGEGIGGDADRASAARIMADGRECQICAE